MGLEQLQAKTNIILGNEFRAISTQTLTVDNTIKKLTVPANAKYALISVESTVSSGIVLRYWVGGAEPSSTVGLHLTPLQNFDISERQNLLTFRVTQAQAGTHKLQIQYYG